MNKKQERQWHINLDYMRAQLLYVLANNDSKRTDVRVRGRIEDVYFMLDELCELTKGEAE